ncbi:MAG: valine--tRNA ligase [Candidatus Bilamarchaeaceae archaeon]
MKLDKYDKTIEKKWQEKWAGEGTFRFDEKDTERELYSIDTPPPFTSGELHMGHVLSYSFFDFVARYKRMRGFNVYYPQGWDTQGFPTEVKVEKKFGRLPREQFREKCVEWTREFITRMRSQMDEMGFSPDWRYEYRTMEPEYHRKVQLSLIRMYRNKQVYRAEYPVYWCPTCVSAIAKAELEDVPKDGMIYDIKFEGPDGGPLTIATTRPELMPACVAVLYNPEDARYKGLEGKKVKTALGKEVPVFADKDVDKEFGTGLLMVCTFGDKMDVVWMHRHKLPLVSVINQYGKMQNCGPELDGFKVAEAKKKMVALLKERGKIIGEKPLAQTVKVHDRCKTAIELIPSMQWFIAIRGMGADIRNMAEKIEWVPDFGIHYLTNWIENAEWDWVISRQRVFGTPLPFYHCAKCSATEPADEKELPFYSERSKPKKCRCGGEMKPEESTCDCWVDSSITPLIISGWPDDKKKFERIYPTSLRPQGVEIVRTWAFYTLVRSGVGLTGKAPWKTILLNGNVLAPDGKKMSKSLGNIISPAQLQAEYPVDAIRQWAAVSGALAKDRPFSYEDIKFAKSFLNKMWNAAKLVQISSEGYSGEEFKLDELGTIDRWMVTRMNERIKGSSEAMERFEFHVVVGKMQEFFWHDFCDNYLEYVKHRTYNPEKYGAETKKAQYVLNYVLLNSLKLMAPFTPHICEEIYSSVYEKEAAKEKSVCLAQWPMAGKEDAGALPKMALFNEVVSAIRRYKAANKMAQNAEIKELRMSAPEKLDAELVEELRMVAKLGKIEIEKGEAVSVLEAKV